MKGNVSGCFFSEHSVEMGTWESNGHVIDDVT